MAFRGWTSEQFSSNSHYTGTRLRLRLFYYYHYAFPRVIAIALLPMKRHYAMNLSPWRIDFFWFMSEALLFAA